MFEEIKFPPCVWNVGGGADISVLLRVLRARIFERGFALESA